jgi:uncharacterized protein YcbK (DUF882 family)
MMTTKYIQRLIYDLGLTNIIIDDKKGPQTELYIRSIQFATGSIIDGIAGEQTLKAMAILKKTKKVKHFAKKEFKCKCCGKVIENIALKLYLEIVKYNFDKKIVIVNSGYRCKKHNQDVGGGTKSQHLLGKAADFKVIGVSAYEVYQFCDKLMFKKGGIGKYTNFTHLDVRNYKARW